MAETVRLSQSGDEQQLKILWKTVFGDEDALIELFFEFYHQPEAAAVLDLDGTVVSMAHMLPMGKLVLPDGEKLPCCAVYALATQPEYRGRGYAAQVTKAAVTHCAGAGYEANVICPSDDTLFGYYHRQAGYADFFYVTETVLRTEDLPSVEPKWGVDIISQPEYSWERERFLNGRVHIELDDRAVSHQKRLCRETGGDLFALHFGGEYVAVAAAERVGDERVVVKELLFDENDPQTAVRAADAAALLASVLPADQYTLRMPAGREESPGNVRRFAMMMPVKGRPELTAMSGRPAWYGFAFD